jgi:hypothetical protein
MSDLPSVENYNVGDVLTDQNGGSWIVGYSYDDEGYGETNQEGGAGKTRTVSYVRNGKRISYKVNAKTGKKLSGKRASPKRRSPKTTKAFLPYDEGAVHDGIVSLGSKSKSEKQKMLKTAMAYFMMKRFGRTAESTDLNVDDLLRRAEANTNNSDDFKNKHKKAVQIEKDRKRRQVAMERQAEYTERMEKMARNRDINKSLSKFKSDADPERQRKQQQADYYKQKTIQAKADANAGRERNREMKRQEALNEKMRQTLSKFESNEANKDKEFNKIARRNQQNSAGKRLLKGFYK